MFDDLLLKGAESHIVSQANSGTAYVYMYVSVSLQYRTGYWAAACTAVVCTGTLAVWNTDRVGAGFASQPVSVHILNVLAVCPQISIYWHISAYIELLAV